MPCDASMVATINSRHTAGTGAVGVLMLHTLLAQARCTPRRSAGYTSGRGPRQGVVFAYELVDLLLGVEELPVRANAHTTVGSRSTKTANPTYTDCERSSSTLAVWLLSTQ